MTLVRSFGWSLRGLHQDLEAEGRSIPVAQLGVATLSNLHSNTVYRGKTIDGHRLSEFVYGTVMATVAVAGIGANPEGWVRTAGIVIAGAVTVWLAHGYAISLSKRVTGGHRLTAQEVAEIFYGSWPIVSAGLIVALPILLSGFGLWSLEAGVAYAAWTGVLLLGLVGLMAGVITNESWGRRILLALVFGLLGVLVISIKYIVAH